MSAAPRTSRPLRLVATPAANTDGVHEPRSFWDRGAPVLRLVREAPTGEALTPELEAECRALEAQSPTAWPPGWPTGRELSARLKARFVDAGGARTAH